MFSKSYTDSYADSYAKSYVNIPLQAEVDAWHAIARVTDSKVTYEFESQRVVQIVVQNYVYCPSTRVILIMNMRTIRCTIWCQRCPAS
jgi:hypothetical protein